MITFKEYYILEEGERLDNVKKWAKRFGLAAALAAAPFAGVQLSKTIGGMDPATEHLMKPETIEAIESALQRQLQAAEQRGVNPNLPPLTDIQNLQPQATPGAPAPQPVAGPPTAIDNIEAISDHIRGGEGVRLEAYDDHRGNRTIGIGHLMTGWSDRRERTVFTNLGYDQNGYNNLYNQRITLRDEAQAEQLFRTDVTEYGIERARRVLTRRGLNIDFLNVELQIVFVDLAFRGDLNREVTGPMFTHNWAELVRILRGRGDSPANRDTGVQTRLNHNAGVIENHITELNQVLV